MAPRIIAAVALRLLLASMATAASPYPDVSPPIIVVLLRPQHPPATGFVNQLRREAEHIFRPTGLEFQWAVDDTKKISGHRMVIVELQGHCSATRTDDLRYEAWREIPLGRTLLSDGEVLSHSVVECDQIARAALRARVDMVGASWAWREALYVRLAGRVLAHELMHALLRTSSHDGADLTRSAIRLDDLGTEPRFSPGQIAALRRVGRASLEIQVAQEPGIIPAR